MKIGNIELKNNIFLAPMAGVSDVGFRALASFLAQKLPTRKWLAQKGLFMAKGRRLNRP